MQPNKKYNIETITKLLQQIQQNHSLTEFDTIKLPFELVNATLSLWESTFPPEVLRQLTGDDTDTLDAWAIAMTQTLNTQLEILNSWLPHLTTLPIPPTIKQKISDRIASINQIANDKSKLLQSTGELLHQEKQLRQKADELGSLKEKARHLQQIQAELQATNLETLRQSILAQAAALEPQQQVLKSLQQQKAELDDQIAALQRQQTTLTDEITYWQSRQNRLETSTNDKVSELITLTQVQRERLSEALSSELAALEQQQESYHQAQQQLQKALTTVNRKSR